jgi:predicted ABC-type transport system involved in lysophospholipase L1 biosynthesis ATPase subunit
VNAIMPGATLADTPARAGQPAPAPAQARILTLATGTSAHSISLELDRGRAYRLVADDAVRSDIIDQLARTGSAALVPADGGLIGNLKVWENLALPLAWQAKSSYAEIEARARAILEPFGFAGERFATLCRALPERLSRFEWRIVAFTRAMLIEPEVMIYDRLFEGLTQSQAEQARRLDAVFHLHFPFRTSIYLESDTLPQLLVPVNAEHDLR